MWGGGSEGQLGHGDVTEVELPKELSVGVPIRMVSCGYYHSAFITGELNPANARPHQGVIQYNEISIISDYVS